MTLPSLSDIPKKLIIMVAIVVVGAGLFFLVRSNPKDDRGGERAELTLWGIFDKEEITPLIGSYQTLQPGVKIKYQKIEKNNYARTLLNALAADQGPDIFMIRNRSLPKELDKIVPASPEQLSVTQFRDLFPTAVEQDFIAHNYVYASPLYLDTLALIYNKNLFDQALLIQPPETWQEFQSFIPRLRKLDQAGRIVRAGAAIGGSKKTIDTSIDLLHLLMIQNGTPMVNVKQTSADFGHEGKAAPGLSAFRFYLQFGNAGSPYYTWNDDQENYLESFASGKTAIIFGYQDTVRELKEKAPFLNFGISAMPQPAGSEIVLNYPDYWGLAVSKKSRFSRIAWNFIVHATTNETGAKSFLNVFGRPPALRKLVGEKLSDPEIGIFARQALTARSWYQSDEKEIQDIFSQAIARALTGRTTPEVALREAEAQTTELMERRR